MERFPSAGLLLVRHAQARNDPGTNYDDTSLSALERMQGDALANAYAAFLSAG